MSVFVDDMYLYPMGQFGRMKMSHMMADTTEELLAMADRIGVARRWIQHEGTPKEHFDVAMSKREEAIRCGAIPKTVDELSEWRIARRRAWANSEIEHPAVTHELYSVDGPTEEIRRLGISSPEKTTEEE